MYRYVLKLLLIVAAVTDLRVYSGPGGQGCSWYRKEEKELVEAVAMLLTQFPVTTNLRFAYPCVLLSMQSLVFTKTHTKGIDLASIQTRPVGNRNTER